VTLTVTDPAGATSTPSVSNSATGTYDASFTLSSAGLWRWTWAASGAVVDVEYGQISAADPSAPAYARLADLKRAVGEINDTARDGLLTAALFAGARMIDRHTGRRFYRDSTTSARTYRTADRLVTDSDGQLLLIDDVATATGLTVEVGDGTTWTAITSYFTEPDNATVRGWPITGLRRDLGNWYHRRARVTAVWGWPASHPEEVEQANLLQAARLYRRKDSPEGVTGNAEFGLARVSRMDPDVAALLRPFVIPGVG